ncbi:MAG: PhzF family phenazine biosynthesis protein [Trueperaceae bacterium]|nr:MAG: PhzF family phenazine biosynthesis protein [Trueperaceae bacterium]
MPPRFTLVDVFSERVFMGNPVAVIAAEGDGDGELATHVMQRITRWLNLSETTFLLPPTAPEADYRVRIFTLEREMPFAGHPTLGTCRAWLHAGGTPKRDDGVVVQECGAGLVRLRVAGDTLAFAAPALLRGGPVEEARLDELAAVLRIPRSAIVDAAWADNGPGWIAVLLETAQAVLDIEPARHHPTRVEVGVVGPYPGGGDAALEVRALFSDHHGNLIEDPVTGSLNASVAQWMLATGRVRAPFTATQGRRVGRDGRVRIDVDGSGTVWVGGHARVLAEGALT